MHSSETNENREKTSSPERHIHAMNKKFTYVQSYVLKRMAQELPHYLTYHNVDHTKDVIVRTEIIADAENISQTDLILVKTAALFHDTGHIIQSKEHEKISCDFARTILPTYDYSKKNIDLVCDIIMATKPPVQPKNILEKILCDADLDYLGRDDFIPISDLLFKELYTQNIITDKNEWNKLQLKFISEHHYFTKFAKNNREIQKQKQIAQLQHTIKD
ncbi:MAG: HD domain-containing protein [Bacteroidales bacterium]